MSRYGQAEAPAESHQSTAGVEISHLFLSSKKNSSPECNGSHSAEPGPSIIPQPDFVPKERIATMAQSVSHWQISRVLFVIVILVLQCLPSQVEAKNPIVLSNSPNLALEFDSQSFSLLQVCVLLVIRKHGRQFGPERYSQQHVLPVLSGEGERREWPLCSIEA